MAAITVILYAEFSIVRRGNILDNQGKPLMEILLLVVNATRRTVIKEEVGRFKEVDGNGSSHTRRRIYIIEKYALRGIEESEEEE